MLRYAGYGPDHSASEQPLLRPCACMVDMADYTIVKRRLPSQGQLSRPKAESQPNAKHSVNPKPLSQCQAQSQP
uniref:Uncharacterized protein n=1 Tax=Acrobeloides nanus TaxID=290746 RepID=A0A914ELA4_9BILA